MSELNTPDAMASHGLPPGYIDAPNSTSTAGGLSSVSDLPAYPTGPHLGVTPARPVSSEQRLKEFNFDIERKGKTVASLILLADGSYSKNVPTFLEGLPITGKACINLARPELVQSVTVSIKGEIVRGPNPDLNKTFVQVSRTLWSREEGDPHKFEEIGGDAVSPNSSLRIRSTRISSSASATSSRTDAEHSSPTKFNGKLQGEYIWQFSLEMPREVAIAFGRRKQIGMFSPPETFSERHANASICYELVLRIARGKLATDYKIPGRFGYIPVIRPPPFSPLRRLAYEDGSLLLGPTVDVYGWHPLGPTVLQGTIFSTRAIQFTCTLYLAKPLAYTRGGLIALYLTLESDDQQALDLLSAPHAVVVRLRRRIMYHSNPEKSLGGYYFRDAVNDSDRAVFWPSTEGTEASSNRKRFLNGELHLKSDMKPSSAMEDFRIEYSLALFPFDTIAYQPSNTNPIFEKSVDIVTFYAPGPRPKKYLPPGYGAGTSAPLVFTMPDMPSFN